MPLFITFEGPDGSGKSTQGQMLAEALRREGYAVTETREPGGTELGEAVRALLLPHEAPPATPLAMAFLLSAARTQHVSEVILPALGRGHVVISDRFADSTVAYQSFGFGLDLQVVRDLTAIATDGLVPDVSVFVDIPPEVGLSRVERRGDDNRLDAEALVFHRRVREGYLELVTADPERWIIVDGRGSRDEVHQAVWQGILPRLKGDRVPL
jgi:dTMP kinase